MTWAWLDLGWAGPGLGCLAGTDWNRAGLYQCTWARLDLGWDGPGLGCLADPGAKIIFPTAVPDPQYELICIQPIRDNFFPPEPMIWNIHDLRLRNKSTHVRGLVILLRWGKEEEFVYTQDAYNQIYVQWMATSDCHTSCTVLSFRGPCHWSWTITLVRGKLTLH